VAQLVAQDAARQGMAHGLKEIEVWVKVPVPGRESAIRALQGHRLGNHCNQGRDAGPGIMAAGPRSAAAYSQEISFTMARYKGPRFRISRRFGQNRFLARRNIWSAALTHPVCTARRSPVASRAITAWAWPRSKSCVTQYGLMEAQFRRMFEKALKKRGVTGETLLQLLETRLDNVVFSHRLCDDAPGGPPDGHSWAHPRKRSQGIVAVVQCETRRCD